MESESWNGIGMDRSDGKLCRISVTAINNTCNWEVLMEWGWKNNDPNPFKVKHNFTEIAYAAEFLSNQFYFHSLNKSG